MYDRGRGERQLGLASTYAHCQWLRIGDERSWLVYEEVQAGEMPDSRLLVSEGHLRM